MADPETEPSEDKPKRRKVEPADEQEEPVRDRSHAVERAESEPEEVPKARQATKRKGTSRRVLRQAAGAAARLAYEHRNELTAALELLKERQAVSDEEEDEILRAYEEGDERTRNVIEELVERLETAKFGKVVIGIREPEGEGSAASGAAPDATTQAPLEETGRRVEQAGRRAVDSVSRHMRRQGGEVVQDIVKRGRDALVQEETKELERVFFKWTTETITKLEQILVRALIGLGVLLILVAILWSAHQVEWMRDTVRFVSVFLLVLVGILLITWSNRVSEWAHDSRREVEDLVERRPSERLHRLLGEDYKIEAVAVEEGPTAPPAPPGKRSGGPPSAK